MGALSRILHHTEMTCFFFISMFPDQHLFSLRHTKTFSFICFTSHAIPRYIFPLKLHLWLSTHFPFSYISVLSYSLISLYRKDSCKETHTTGIRIIKNTQKKTNKTNNNNNNKKQNKKKNKNKTEAIKQ